MIDVVKLIQRQSEWKVKRLYSDGGGEFVNGTLKEFAASEGILLRNSPARTQQLDGVAERVVRTGKDMERTMLLHAGLDAAVYYKLASHHAVFVWNRTYISPQTGVTPFEAMYKRKPSMQHWAVFGCDCFYHVPKEDRRTYDAKMLPGIYVGSRSHSQLPNRAGSGDGQAALHSRRAIPQRTLHSRCCPASWRPARAPADRGRLQRGRVGSAG